MCLQICIIIFTRWIHRYRLSESKYKYCCTKVHLHQQCNCLFPHTLADAEYYQLKYYCLFSSSILHCTHVFILSEIYWGSSLFFSSELFPVPPISSLLIWNVTFVSCTKFLYILWSLPRLIFFSIGLSIPIQVLSDFNHCSFWYINSPTTRIQVYTHCSSLLEI